MCFAVGSLCSHPTRWLHCDFCTSHLWEWSAHRTHVVNPWMNAIWNCESKYRRWRFEAVCCGAHSWMGEKRVIHAKLNRKRLRWINLISGDTAEHEWNHFFGQSIIILGSIIYLQLFIVLSKSNLTIEFDRSNIEYKLGGLLIISVCLQASVLFCENVLFIELLNDRLRFEINGTGLNTFLSYSFHCLADSIAYFPLFPIKQDMVTYINWNGQ